MPKIKTGEQLADALAAALDKLDVDPDADAAELSCAMVEFAAGFCFSGYQVTAMTTKEDIDRVCAGLMNLFRNEFELCLELERVLRVEIGEAVPLREINKRLN